MQYCYQIQSAHAKDYTRMRVGCHRTFNLTYVHACDMRYECARMGTGPGTVRGVCARTRTVPVLGTVPMVRLN